MTIRDWVLTDCLPVIALIEEAHTRSTYAGVSEVDREYTRRFMARSLHFNRNSNHGASLMLVSEKDGKIEGYFWGFLDRLYQVGTHLAATDMHFYLTPNADPRDAVRIISEFTAWAAANPKVVEIRIGASNVMGEIDPRFEALLIRKGFEKGATVFTQRIEQCQA